MSKILINKAAYFHNLGAISKKSGGKIIAVLKDNAYGHGAAVIAPLAREFGVKKVAVKSEKEAGEIAAFFDEIIILSHIPTGSENPKYTYAVNDLSNLNVLKKGTRTHLAIDTMMHRNGIKKDDIATAFKMAKDRQIAITGAFTHFRSSDELSGEFFVQRENFATAKAILGEFFGKNGVKPLFHSHNSAALERAIAKNSQNLDTLDGEYCRVGIAQFGYAQFDESLGLKRVLSLWAERVSAREIAKGECVGYGGVFVAPEKMRVATYDLGYGDGLLRFNGVGDLAIANGGKILGKMSMDSFTTADFGPSVCVFDDARVWADFFGTISYEILVKLSPNIVRKII